MRSRLPVWYPRENIEFLSCSFFSRVLIKLREQKKVYYWLSLRYPIKWPVERDYTVYGVEEHFFAL